MQFYQIQDDPNFLDNPWVCDTYLRFYFYFLFLDVLEVLLLMVLEEMAFLMAFLNLIGIMEKYFMIQCSIFPSLSFV
jgi:hypothetical protein